MTSRNKGSPVSWSGEGRGGATLSKKAPLGGKVVLGRRVALGGGLAF